MRILTKKKTGLEVEKQESNIWFWITSALLLLALIGGNILIYQQWNRQQKLKRLEARLQELQEKRDKVHRQYQLQELNLISAAPLAESPAIHSFFSDLLGNYAEKFAKSKKLDISQLPLKFTGFYYDQETGKKSFGEAQGFRNMGRCFKNGIIRDYSFPHQVIYPYKKEEVNIEFNHLYLLNKFGHDKYFTSYPQGDYFYIDISFDKMIDTCSHEIAHYIQLVKHSKSSCESDLILGNGKYDEGLAKEHWEWTGEIYQMIKGEISELEKRWKEIN